MICRGGETEGREGWWVGGGNTSKMNGVGGRNVKGNKQRNEQKRAACLFLSLCKRACFFFLLFSLTHAFSFGYRWLIELNKSLIHSHLPFLLLYTPPFLAAPTASSSKASLTGGTVTRRVVRTPVKAIPMAAKARGSGSSAWVSGWVGGLVWRKVGGWVGGRKEGRTKLAVPMPCAAAPIAKPLLTGSVIL